MQHLIKLIKFTCAESNKIFTDFFATIEWLAKFKFREVADSLRVDGVAPGGATTTFRNDLKDEIISAVWRGVGGMLLAAGNPAVGCD